MLTASIPSMSLEEVVQLTCAKPDPAAMSPSLQAVYNLVASARARIFGDGNAVDLRSLTQEWQMYLLKTVESITRHLNLYWTTRRACGRGPLGSLVVHSHSFSAEQRRSNRALLESLLLKLHNTEEEVQERIHMLPPVCRWSGLRP